jgi:hypothetical protein
MKKIIFIFAVFLTFISNSHANSFELKKNTTSEISTNIQINNTPTDCEFNIDKLIYSNEFWLNNLFDCTLSAELSYMGVAIKFSITEENCEAAGRGIAQAMRGFLTETLGKK